ncbi:MAG: c-type cytochrome biogenesis protein CcmI [Sneathiellales bacterium]|nr:c-type cytochrome biogenesis protein CcmI [Sneathiellales bacterium]
MTWIILAVITLLALIILARPLFGRGVSIVERTEGGLEVYRQQLKELDTDIERGVLSEAEAEPTRFEIQRRMIALSKGGIGTKARFASGGIPQLLLLLLVPAFSFALYWQLGSPELPSKPLAERDIAKEKRDLAGRDLSALVSRLAEKLQENPENVDGWILLARTLSRMERYEDAATTFLKATTIAPNDVDLYVGAGENFYFHADGKVSSDAEKAFKQAYRLDPTHAGARYYLALRDAQEGKSKKALDAWITLYVESEPTAPYMRILKARISELAEKTGRDVKEILASREAPPTPAGPSRDDMEAAAQMSAKDREAMIQGMVSQLATRMKEAPEFAGLMRLGKVYGTLKEYHKSAGAYEEAARLQPSDPVPLIRQAFALTRLAGDKAPPTDKAVELYRKALSLDPENFESLWYLGIAEARAGNMKAARKYWEDLYALAPDGSEIRENVRKAINAL